MLKFNRKILASVAMMACVGLAGCRDAASSLGIGRRSAPDEFLVVSSPPLTVPPNFTLTEPMQTKPSNSLHAPQTVQRSLTNEEKSLLGKMNSTSTVTNEPASVAEQEKKHFIDPIAERARLSKNQKEGRPVNEGKVEERSKTEPSTLEKIFG